METQRMKLTNVKSDSLPLDLVMEILKRLPVKTLIRFLSVSKLWASTIRSRDFMKLFMDVSLTRPKGLLFLFRHGYCGSALSSKTHESSSFTAFHASCNSSQWSTQWSTVSPSVHGGMHDLVKVFRVLTVGTESSWKKIENNIISHAPFGQELCISGVLYYQGLDTGTKMYDLTIMSFDVRSEKLYPIKGPSSSRSYYMHFESSKLISYEEKLAVLYLATDVRLCVLEDDAKEEWSTKTFVLSTTIPAITI
ncbi:hypothetical protein Bca101_000758 [Brassica carinata]